MHPALSKDSLGREQASAAGLSPFSPHFVLEITEACKRKEDCSMGRLSHDRVVCFLSLSPFCSVSKLFSTETIIKYPPSPSRQVLSNSLSFLTMQAQLLTQLRKGFWPQSARTLSLERTTFPIWTVGKRCLLYTSDAADDRYKV